MKRHDDLYDRIVTFDNILLAAKKAGRGKRHKPSVAQFFFSLEKEVIALQAELVTGTYQPRPYTMFEIREPKIRNICSSEFRDRVVHHAICNIIEPTLENKAIYDSYACRIGKGAHMAIKRCQHFASRYKYFLKCDIRKFFENINHQHLKILLRRVFKDQKLLSLLDQIIDHEVPGGMPGCGLPIGNLTSQHFANFFLGQIDHFIKDQERTPGYLRYMDDFISFAPDKGSLGVLLGKIEVFLERHLRLQLKEKATLIAPVSEGIPFLGFRVYPNLIRLKRENLVRLRKTIRGKERLYLEGRISENELVRSMTSIIGHVSHVDSQSERRKIFERSLKLA
ncbi:MAG: reverse transcriptase domain-containing protein [Bacteriovoracia bacterium]